MEELPLLGMKIVVIRLLWRILGDGPVLAEFTLQITTRSSDGKGSRSGKDMEKGLLLYGIGMDGTGKAVDHGIEFSPSILPRLTLSPLSRPKDASPGTELTLNQILT